MRHLISATRNSWRALRHLSSTETAIKIELAALVAAVPIGWIISASWRGFALLLVSLLIVMLVEVVNTSIEATCNAITRENDPDIRIAKDCGSLAVALGVIIAAVVWGLAVVDYMSISTI